MWNAKDLGASEMNHHQPHQRPVFILGDVVYLVGLEGSPLLRTPYRKTINSNKYCLENARLYVSLKTRQLSQLGWKVLIHPLYSLDITPPDHLFQSL